MTTDALRAEMAALQARPEPELANEPAPSPPAQAPTFGSTPPVSASPPPPPAQAQPAPADLEARIQQLNQAMREARWQMHETQRQREDDAQRHRAELAQMQDNWRYAMQTIAQQQQPAQAPEPEYDPEQEPIRALKQLSDKVKFYEAERAQNYYALQQQYAQQQQAEQQQQQQAMYVRSLKSGLERIEDAFAVQFADYPQAAAHYVGERRKQLKWSYPHATPEQIDGEIELEVLRMHEQAQMAGGASTPQLIYQMSQNLGWRPGVVAQAPAAGAPAPAAGQPAPAASDPLALVREGQRSAVSLGAGPGAPDSGAEDLMAMSKLDGASFRSSFTKFLRENGARV